jgi:hypothetical protein
MMGSGTVLIEACLMGVKSAGVDASPFCRFMTQAKLDALRVPLPPVRAAVKHSESVFAYFTNLAGHPRPGCKARFEDYVGELFSADGVAEPHNRPAPSRGRLPKGCEDPVVQDFLLLAYLDSAGYSERSTRRSPYEQFQAVQERYLFVAEKVQRILAGTESELGEARSLEGDARRLPLGDCTVDGIIFSPPYSFAIDYLANDSFHLGFLGVDVSELRKRMIGLRGRTLREKFDLYKRDMDEVLSECARVLQPGRICTIVVGTNNNQLSKILDVPPDEVPGIEDVLGELGGHYGLRLVRKMSRQITGMANTMRNEFIVMLQRQ